MFLYHYTKSIDTVSVDSLADEIFTNLSKRVKKTDGTVPDGYISYSNDGSVNNLEIGFTIELNASEQTTLDTVVSSHTI